MACKRPRKKRKLTWLQRVAFCSPINPQRNTEKVIPLNQRMRLKAV